MMIQNVTKSNRVPKLIMLNEATKKELTLQAVHFGKSLQVYIEQILCTSKSSCPAVVAGSNCEEDGHRHRGQ
jgi:hypothetical protein